MNVSEQGLSNAHFNIPNGCLTKKLQPFKDDNKTRKTINLAKYSTFYRAEKRGLCEKFKKYFFDCLEKAIGS